MFRRGDYRYWATKWKYFLGPCEDVGLRNIFSYDIQRYLLKLPSNTYWYKRQEFVKFPTCSTVDTASTYIFKQLNYIIVLKLIKPIFQHNCFGATDCSKLSFYRYGKKLNAQILRPRHPSADKNHSLGETCPMEAEWDSN